MFSVVFDFFLFLPRVNAPHLLCLLLSAFKNSASRNFLGCKGQSDVNITVYYRAGHFPSVCRVGR